MARPIAKKIGQLLTGGVKRQKKQPIKKPPISLQKIRKLLEQKKKPVAKTLAKVPAKSKKKKKDGKPAVGNRA